MKGLPYTRALIVISGTLGTHQKEKGDMINDAAVTICPDCHRRFFSKKAYLVHYIFGHETRICPKCDNRKRICKTVIKLEDKPESFRMAAGTRKIYKTQYMHEDFYQRQNTVYNCTGCGIEESSADFHKRIVDKLALEEEITDGSTIQMP
jgi:hypothetical protein